jgi:predicted DNA-binding transcriptional regulator YafY
MRKARQLAIALLLQAQGHLTVRQLARLFGVSDRTVARDSVELAMAGVTLEATRGPGGGYRLERGTRIDPRRFVRGPSPTPPWSAGGGAAGRPVPGDAEALALERLRLAVRQIARDLPEETRAGFEDALAHLQFDVQPAGIAGGEPPCLGDILTALWSERQLRIGYPDGGDAVERAIEPYTLVSRRGQWYLMAYDLDDDEMRVFHVARIRKAGAHDAPATLADRVQLQGRS